MNNDNPRENNLKFIKRERKPISLPDEVIDLNLTGQANEFPLIIQPKVSGVSLAHWVQKNRALLETKLLSSASLLFRGFQPMSASEFESFVKTNYSALSDYNEPSTPRTKISSVVYTSTDYPSNQKIPLHNELSYSNLYPLKIFFFCLLPAEIGGETPIVDGRRLIREIPTEILTEFTARKLMYVRNYGEGLGLDWAQAFGTNDKTKVEDYCRQSNIDFEWRGDDRLQTRQIRPAVIRHPRTDETVWFNQAHLHHISALSPEIRQSLSEIYAGTEPPLGINTYYGDGSPIEDSVLAEIRKAYEKVAVDVAWQSGDVLMLDNVLAAHGRNRFTGARQILVAMAEQSVSG